MLNHLIALLIMCKKILFVLLILNFIIMKKLFLMMAFVAVSVVSTAQVIVSSCGTSVYMPEPVSVQEALEIYDALEAAC